MESVVKSSFLWAVVVAGVLAMGTVACGSDGGGGSGGSGGTGGTGGGDPSGGICDESSAEYDETACDECNAKATQCFLIDGVCSDEYGAIQTCAQTKCGAQIDSLNTCQTAADADCEAQFPDDFDAYMACFDAACTAEDAALNSCGDANCMGKVTEFIDCFKAGCPDAAACIEW